MLSTIAIIGLGQMGCAYAKHAASMAESDLSPKNKTMTKMRNPLKLLQWRTQNEKTLQ